MCSQSTPFCARTLSIQSRMKRPWLLGPAVLFAALVGCANAPPPPVLSAEDVIRPTLGLDAGLELAWVAGQPAGLGMRLQREPAAGGPPLPLTFAGVPDDVHPHASIAFYKGDTALTALEVDLTHRC